MLSVAEMSYANSVAVSPPPDANDGFEDQYNNDKYGRAPPSVDTGVASKMPLKISKPIEVVSC